jgi:hypothetical protein
MSSCARAPLNGVATSSRRRSECVCRACAKPIKS